MQINKRKAKNSLKFKAKLEDVTLKIKPAKGKIVSVETSGRIIQSGPYAFVSIPAIFQLTKNGVEIEDEQEAILAAQALNPKPNEKKRIRKVVSLPQELAAALSSIPTGFRLGYGTDGSLKLVKTRVRTKKN